MAEYHVQVVNASLLGEGPHWDAGKQELFYVDIFKQYLHRYVPVSGEHYQVRIPDGTVSLAVPISNEPNKYLIGHGRDLAVVDWDGHSTEPESVEVIHSVDIGKPANRLNDGKCDSTGRLWAGTMSEGDIPFDGSLYKIDNAGNVDEVVAGVGTSNGIAWSSDNTLMYYNDTATGKVDVFDFNNSAGTISNRRTVYDFWGIGEGGSPDGMTIDSDGNLWVGCWGGWKAIQVDPRTGTKLSQIDFPAANITSLAFGGPDLNTLFATSAYTGLSDEDLRQQPAAGALFQVTNVGATGQSGGYSYTGPISASFAKLKI